ncbi:MAG TPA: hypothetical protein VFZ61_29600 [Polyangiales bacterium]
MHSTRRLLTVRILGMATIASVAACDDDAARCKEGERSYRDGDHWTCSDGCNYCECRDGETSQTAISCPSPPGPAAGKKSCGSMNRRHGDSWQCDESDAKCEMCSCDDGVVTRGRSSCDPAADD